MIGMHSLMCFASTFAGSPPGTPEVIRTANRLAANEGQAVVLEGLAVDITGRPCIHLDRADAIVEVAARGPWEADTLGKPVRGRGTLERHAAANDPATGIASLQLARAAVDLIAIPDDGLVRTAPEMRGAENNTVDVEGMAYRSSNGPILILYGGLAYVRGLSDWDKATVTRTVVVRGTVTHPKLPPDAPPAGGSWTIAATALRSTQ